MPRGLEGPAVRIKQRRVSAMGWVRESGAMSEQTLEVVSASFHTFSRMATLLCSMNILGVNE